jgi:hypothetical protein
VSYEGVLEPGKALSIGVSGLAASATLKAFLNQQPIVFDPVIVADSTGNATFDLILPAGYVGESAHCWSVERFRQYLSVANNRPSGFICNSKYDL